MRYALIPAFLLWLGLSSAHAVPYTIASSAASPQASGLFAQTVTNPATLNLTAGDTLLVFVDECGDTNCATTNGPQPSSITVSAGAIGACVPIIGNTINYLNSLIAEKCPITQGATNVNVTANYPSNAYWSQIIAVDVNQSPTATLTDEGIGLNATVGNQQNVSVGLMTPTQSTNFVIAALVSGAAGIDNSPGQGFTTIQNPVEPNGNQGFLVEYMITSDNSPVAATGSLSAPEDLRMVAAVLN